MYSIHFLKKWFYVFGEEKVLSSPSPARLIVWWRLLLFRRRRHRSKRRFHRRRSRLRRKKTERKRQLCHKQGGKHWRRKKEKKAMRRERERERKGNSLLLSSDRLFCWFFERSFVMCRYIFLCKICSGVIHSLGGILKTFSSGDKKGRLRH